MSLTLGADIREKLARILRIKADRGGEYCLPFEPQNFPLDISLMLPEYRERVLEIGCGWGEFTRAWAELHPQTLVIAVEKKLARVRSSSATQRAQTLENIRYLVLDVAWFFEGVFAPAQFSEVYINFPDPWPKARHHKHRFISPTLLDTLASICRPQARLNFATDNYDYAREAMTAMETHPRWRNTQGSYTARRDIPGRPQSYFEMLHRREGAIIYFLEYALC
jgi:tRNA (guanine-N7-)-methyltransferase